MKRYEIAKMIMLDFLTAQDQITTKYYKGEGFVEWDGKNTVWFVNHGNVRWETINTADVIEMYVNHGALIEIEDED